MLRFFTLWLKLLLLLAVLGIATGAYLIYYYSQDLPDYSQLKEYHPPCVTRMYSSDGKLIEEYAREHRIFVPIDNVPKSLVEAFIAAEDKNFYDHSGIDIISIMRAAILNIANVINSRRVEGGSTITQQVVKNFLLSSERSIERKIKEAILSYMVSQTFTKDQILELYLNQIYLGKGAYGVAAAALAYFNKSVAELTINESSVLASLPKAPSKFNPERNYERAVARKNYVIGRMYDDGYITEAQAREAINQPIKLIKPDKIENINADYYAEVVRDEVINMFGEEYFYTAGLTIFTCIDSNLQKHAANALIYGIRKYDMKRGYRGPIKNIKITNWQHNLKTIHLPSGMREYELAIVLAISHQTVRIGLNNGKTGTLHLKDMLWTKNNLKSVNHILSVGDIIVVLNEGKTLFLRQIPKINGGIIVIEPSTGRVLAAEGGYDFSVSKFDRTTQAKRQPGSLIKPFVYLAALENGIKPNTLFDDAPIVISQGKGMPMWKPKNYENNFLGPITMRKGLEKSRNNVTVRVAQAAGLNKVTETIRRFGINDNPIKRYSIVLGAIETTLARMTTAYGTIANQGKKIIPHYIELIKDRKGNVLYKRDYTECVQCKSYISAENGDIFSPEIPKSLSHIITDDATSYQITSLMIGGIQRGTGQRAKQIPKIIAGKTGTTNESKDTWFIGFTPQIVVGTYIGYDNPRTLGKRATGASVALPVFVDFMTKGYKDIPSTDFEVPKSIDLASIDYDTGNPSSGPGAIIEAFKANSYTFIPKKINKQDSEDLYDPFEKIENYDSSKEIY